MAQYPRITPPSVKVSITYPGASAQVVADTVAAPIEQQVTGVPGMLYMSSQMGNDGTYSLSVTFDVGVDLNTALVMVQNRVALAMPLLADAGAEPGHHHPQEDARHSVHGQFHLGHAIVTTKDGQMIRGFRQGDDGDNADCLRLPTGQGAVAIPNNESRSASRFTTTST